MASERWQNWAGSLACEPAASAAPASEREIQQAVRDAAARPGALRVAGSGHSFSPLVPTDGTLLSLEHWCGLLSVSDGGAEPSAWLRAGSVLHELGDVLLAQGLAFENLGDIDVQSVAGALATGTHGTGVALGNLSSRVRAMRLVLASGEMLEIDSRRGEDAELLRAARVSLGVLGVVTAVEIALVPAFRLHERIRRIAVEEALADLEGDCAAQRHYEFFWLPTKDVVEAKSLSATEAPVDDLPGHPHERIGWSTHILPSVRNDRFVEMEYSVPAADGVECFREVRARMQARHADVAWPVEYRRVAADDAMLSMASGRDSATISLHQDARLPYREFFGDLEPIFASCGGRPHWGKAHTREGRDLAALYPDWEAFADVRERLDPQGLFLGPPLRALLGA